MVALLHLTATTSMT